VQGYGFLIFQGEEQQHFRDIIYQRENPGMERMPSVLSLFEGVYQSLRGVVENFARMQCVDPRKKIYGLLGLVDERERPELDYGKSLYEVYIDAVGEI
jgi:hypothetical protein